MKLVLITGEPGSGKTHLSKRLYTKGYTIVHLDNEYIGFIKEQYPSLYLPDIACVISQHYKTILSDRGRAKWKKLVIETIKRVSKTNYPYAIEGYLLSPILEEVIEKLPKRVNATVVIVRNRKYYIQGSFEDIAGEGKR